MTKTILALLFGAALAVAQTSIPSVNPSSIGTGDDVMVGTGIASGYVGQQPSSLSSISLKVQDQGGKTTYVTTTFGLSFGSIANAVKTGSFAQASTAMVIKSGITQVFWRPKPHWAFLCETQLGITKFDWATLGNANGGIGLAFDAGGYLTRDKYHVYIVPMATEVSIASRQVKPAYIINVVTGFKKN